MKVQTYDDLGKTVFEGFLVVNPMGMSKIKIVYTLPTSIDSSDLLVQKQSGVEGQKYKILIEGKSLFNGPMERDMEFK